MKRSHSEGASWFTISIVLEPASRGGGGGGGGTFKYGFHAQTFQDEYIIASGQRVDHKKDLGRIKNLLFDISTTYSLLYNRLGGHDKISRLIIIMKISSRCCGYCFFFLKGKLLRHHMVLTWICSMIDIKGTGRHYWLGRNLDVNVCKLLFPDPCSNRRKKITYGYYPIFSQICKDNFAAREYPNLFDYFANFLFVPTWQMQTVVSLKQCSWWQYSPL